MAADPIIIRCPCGTPRTLTPYDVRMGRKYCSMACARKYRVYATKAETLSAKVTITMTPDQRTAMEARADDYGMSITELGRRYIVERLEDEA